MIERLGRENTIGNGSHRNIKIANDEAAPSKNFSKPISGTKSIPGVDITKRVAAPSADRSFAIKVNRTISETIHTLVTNEKAGDEAEICFGEHALWKIATKPATAEGSLQKKEIFIFANETKSRSFEKPICQIPYATNGVDKDPKLASNLISYMGAIMHVAPKAEDIEKNSSDGFEIRYPNGTLPPQIPPPKVPKKDKTKARDKRSNKIAGGKNSKGKINAPPPSSPGNQDKHGNVAKFRPDTKPAAEKIKPPEKSEEKETAPQEKSQGKEDEKIEHPGGDNLGEKLHGEEAAPPAPSSMDDKAKEEKSQNSPNPATSK